MNRGGAENAPGGRYGSQATAAELGMIGRDAFSDLPSSGDHETFLDLAWKNIEHWCSSTDQRNILTKSRFPMLAASGVDPSTIEDPDNPGRVVLGPHAVLTSEDAHAKWYYVEARGSAIEQGRKDLETLENQMITMGVEPIRLRQNNQITATQTGVDEVKARSILEQWALDFINYLERCFKTGLEWQGIYGSPVDLDLTTDLTLNGNSAQQIDVLLRARAQGDLSRLTLWDELMRRDFLSAHFDPDVERSLLEEDLLFGAQSTAFGTFLNSQAINGNLVGVGGAG